MTAITGHVVTFLGPPPPVTVLCGSTRYVTKFNQQAEALARQGHVILSIEIATAQSRDEDPQHADPAAKAALDDLHRRKIDIAAGLGGRVLVVSDESGYFGASTRGEIDYARDLGVPVDFLVPASEVLDRRHAAGMFP